MSNKNKKKLAPYKKQLNLRHHYLAQRYDLAEKVGLKLTKKYPNDQFSFNILSLVYRETNRLSESFEFNKKAISIAPNDPMLYNNLGNFFKDAGKKEEAEKNYKYALSIDNQLLLAHKSMVFEYSFIRIKFLGAIASIFTARVLLLKYSSSGIDKI